MHVSPFPKYLAMASVGWRGTSRAVKDMNVITSSSQEPTCYAILSSLVKKKRC